MKQLSERDCLILNKKEAKEIAKMLYKYVFKNENAELKDRREANDIMTSISYVVEWME